MKAIITFLLLLTFTSAYSQTEKYETLLDSAKALFKSTTQFDQAQLDSFDYAKVVSFWEEVVRLDPNNAEARYFLGYAYDRSNSSDGRGIIDMHIQLVLKASAEFEKVIALTPHYTGEKIVLDPYSNLTVAWGTMAMNYIYHNKIDSALWAFKEGKKRGGFSDVILAMNKLTLDQCSQNSILISSGDNMTVPLWYLQNVEGYRKDVSVVDVNMLNTTWYPRFIAENGSVSFDMPLADIDTIEYIPWTEAMITINGFSWLVKPSCYDTYLLRGDRIFLSLLKQNAFRKDLFFTVNFPVEARLSLQDYISSYIYVDKLTIKKKQVLSYKQYKTAITRILKLAPQMTLNKPDEMMIFDYFRLSLLSQANQLVDVDKRTQARELLSLLDQYCDEDKLPYSHKDIKVHATYIRSRIGTAE